MKKICLLTQLVMVTMILFCVKTNERNGRINPFDPQGDNWFPPTVEIIEKDTIRGIIADSVTVTVAVSDKNGTVKYLEWSQDSLSVFKVDTLDSFFDTLIVYDTLSAMTVTSVDTTFYDTTNFDSTSGKPEKYELVDVTMIIYLVSENDSLYDTLSYKDSTSDSTFFFEKQDSTLYIIKLVMKHDSTFNDTSYIDNPVIDAVFYYYTFYFTFEVADTFQLFVTAIDNDSLESEVQDSVTIIISD